MIVRSCSTWFPFEFSELNVSLVSRLVMFSCGCTCLDLERVLGECSEGWRYLEEADWLLGLEVKSRRLVEQFFEGDALLLF